MVSASLPEQLEDGWGEDGVSAGLFSFYNIWDPLRTKNGMEMEVQLHMYKVEVVSERVIFLI